jgi:hypothetical protein
MNFYLVDFFPKPAHAKKELLGLHVRVLANDVEQAKQAAHAEILLENPDFDVREFDIQVNAPMLC